MKLNKGGFMGFSTRRYDPVPFETEQPDAQQPTANKYHRQLNGSTVDVYDVLKAFNVTCPALQHLIKKALCCGLRGHKNQSQDLQDILDSAKRAKELHNVS